MQAIQIALERHILKYDQAENPDHFRKAHFYAKAVNVQPPAALRALPLRFPLGDALNACCLKRSRRLPVRTHTSQ